jgi:hypothetical protein
MSKNSIKQRDVIREAVSAGFNISETTMSKFVLGRVDVSNNIRLAVIHGITSLGFSRDAIIALDEFKPEPKTIGSKNPTKKPRQKSASVGPNY